MHISKGPKCALSHRQRVHYYRVAKAYVYELPAETRSRLKDCNALQNRLTTSKYPYPANKAIQLSAEKKDRRVICG